MRYSSSIVLAFTSIWLALFPGAYAQSTPPKAPANSPKIAGVAVLRVSCDGVNAGAEVSVNDEIKGRCPIDMEIPIGVVRVRAAKPIDPQWERTFEDELRLGTGVVQRVEVVLGARQPTVATVKRWETAAAAGHAEANYQLGWMYEWGTAGTVDFVKSSTYLRRAAEAGHPAAMAEYALALRRGRGVPKDEASYEAWMIKAGEKGDAQGLVTLASYYQYGSNGRPTDLEKAKELYLKASLAGSAYGYDSFKELEKDQKLKDEYSKRGAENLLKLAEAGDMGALSRLATMYKFNSKYSEGGSARYGARAAEWEGRIFTYYKKAAATGDADSNYRFGRSYRYGINGASKDRTMAEKFFREAVAAGSSDAKEELDAMLKE